MFLTGKEITVEPWYNKSLYNKVLSITNSIFCPSQYTKNLVIANRFCQSLGPSLYQGSIVQ